MASRKSYIPYLALLVAVLSLTGCYFGKSKIVVSDGGTYDIYANEEFVCTTRVSDCGLTTRGSTSPVQLQAVKNGRVMGVAYASRSITAASILWGPFTYWTSIFIYKAYPDEIFIYVGDKDGIRDADGHFSSGRSSWIGEGASTGSDGGSDGSVWDKPLIMK